MLSIDSSEVRPRHRGELRVVVVATGPAGRGQVRGYLTADLIRRYTERIGLAPTVVDFSPDDEKELRAACDALNIHPPRHTLALPLRLAQLDGLFPDGVRQPVFDVGVRTAADGPLPEGVAALAGRWLEVREPGRPPGGEAGGGAAVGQQAGHGEEAGHGAAGQAGAGQGTAGRGQAGHRAARQGEAGHGAAGRGQAGHRGAGQGEVGGEGVTLGEEPLAVRMKMLGADGDAAATLARWRRRVARWARSPSGAISRPHADAIGAAFEDGLDAGAALRVLEDLEADDGVPDGVKFETFAAADRLFGLDLARDIGR